MCKDKIWVMRVQIVLFIYPYYKGPKKKSYNNFRPWHLPKWGRTLIFKLIKLGNIHIIKTLCFKIIIWFNTCNLLLSLRLLLLCRCLGVAWRNLFGVIFRFLTVPSWCFRLLFWFFRLLLCFSCLFLSSHFKILNII